MIWTIRRAAREFPGYERPVQIALLSGLVLLAAALIALLAAPMEQRVGILIGMGALVVVMQAALLFANRHLVSAYTSAQRLYLAEDFAGAVAILETERAAGRADMRALTLLGNTYRQMGGLEASATVLYEALNKDPHHPFPLYGIGRTLLSGGQFSEAAASLQHALAAGAAPIAWLDVAEAAFCLDDAATMQQALSNVVLSPEDVPHVWMADHLRWRAGAGDKPVLSSTALRYWEAMAARFATTPYGRHLRTELLLYSRTELD